MRGVIRPEAVERTDGTGLAACRQEHAGPVLAAFADSVAGRRPRAPSESAIGAAVTDASTQRRALGAHLTDGRLTIDTAAAEQASRPLCVGARNGCTAAGTAG